MRKIQGTLQRNAQVHNYIQEPTNIFGTQSLFYKEGCTHHQMVYPCHSILVRLKHSSSH